MWWMLRSYKTVAQEASDSIQLGVDQERMAAVSATDVLVPTESDSAPRWLTNCPKDGAGGFVVKKKLAKRYFESTGWAIPNDARSSVMEFIRKCITCQKSRAKLDKTTLPRNSLHNDRPFKVIQMDFWRV